MTTYGAYNAGLPCKNPHCKSVGRSHPNCRCYPTMMAEGGEVERSCDGPHQEGCDLYMAEPRDEGTDFAAALAHLGASGLIDHDDVGKHFRAIRQGHKAINKAMDSVFEESGERHEPDEKARTKIDDYLKEGGVTRDLNEISYGQSTPQMFAEGGAVESGGGLAEHFPVQNVLAQAAKGRISNYLNSLRPSSQSIKLPFDDDHVDHEAKRKYHRAIDVANDPLSVLSHINRGTIEPEHMQHLGAVAPELGEHLQKGLTERIIKAQLSGNKPSYKTRQGLSLFMGAALSSEMTPASIQAAQATFAARSQQQGQSQPTPKAKGGKSLSKSDEAFLTGDQALAKRGQAQRG